MKAFKHSLHVCMYNSAKIFFPGEKNEVKFLMRLKRTLTLTENIKDKSVVYYLFM